MKQSANDEFVNKQCREIVEVLAACRDPRGNDNPTAVIDAFAETIEAAKRAVGDRSAG